MSSKGAAPYTVTSLQVNTQKLYVKKLKWSKDILVKCPACGIQTIIALIHAKSRLEKETPIDMVNIKEAKDGKAEAKDVTQCFVVNCEHCTKLSAIPVKEFAQGVEAVEVRRLAMVGKWLWVGLSICHFIA